MAKSQIRQYVFSPTGTTGGTITVPGKIDLQQLLVITNTTTNSILYNFADSTYTGTTVSFYRANDTNFATALDNTDGVTIITIPSTISTSGMTSSNVLQIFFEQSFQYVRSPEVGTDAFERQRTAGPQSMIDADFEYGMQPTKWLTISQQRGYPAIYEIPGTDQTVTAATTDASAGSGGLVTSESIITITTATAHGFSVGTPFTISGFNSSIVGFDRAQGSFIVFSVPSTTTFSFIAKGKVGTVNGDNVYTPFIQLRSGGFYSGSNINAVIGTTITATTTGTNYVTVISTAGIQSGSAISISTVVTNATGTNQNTNYITVGSTVGMYPGMPLVFSGGAFGGLVSGTTYYVVTIVDIKTITVSLSSNLTPLITPTTAINGNMTVTGGAFFGGITANTVYYVNQIISGTQITISNNIVYTTTIAGTNATLNAVNFGTTVNMTVGEAVVVTGTTIGNLSAGTYYIVQIIDSNYATVSTTPGGSVFTMTTATGSMSAVVGVNATLSSATGYLAAIIVAPVTLTYSTPSTVVNFTGTISGTTLTATSVSGTFAVGQGISGTGVPSSTVIQSQLTATNSASATTTLVSGGAANSFTFVVISVTNILVGQLVAGSALPASAFVTGINGTTVTVSQAFTSGGGSGNYSFYTPYQAGTYQINTNTGTASGASCVAVNTQPVITVNTYSPHGFTPGDTINMYVSSESGFNNHTLATGPFFVENISTNTVNGVTIANQFTYTARGVGIISGTISAILYARPDSFYSHRPFDGGVQLGTGLPSHGAQAIRMSKKYIRYQSGKGINFNTGLLMAPNYYVRTVFSYTGTTNYVTGLAITNVTSAGVVTITQGTYVTGQAIIVSGSITTTNNFAAGTYYVLVGGTNVTLITIATTLANVIANTAAVFTSTSAVSGATATLTSIIQIVTDDVDHGCQVGAGVLLTGVVSSGFNGNYTVAGIIDERNLLVVAQSALASTAATTYASINDPCFLSLTNWYGSTVRSGTYDEQNGVFFQYDGQNVSIVRRSSTYQLAGTINAVVGSGQIIGINTRFTSQLYVGDRVVIRGMSHMITQVVSDTLMYVNPQFRGYSNLYGIKMTKTIDYIVPQSKWNTDRMDGSNGPFNPSGYLLNPWKMQMVGLQWTWYGAGFIDWMMRGPEGKFVTVHRLRNNNLNNEGWMRTGNIPVRYEVQNEAARTWTVGTVSVSPTDLVIPVNDTSIFPTPSTVNAGTGFATVYIDNEIIQYTAKINTIATAISGGNTITVGSTANMATGQPIVFIHPFGLSMGGIVSGQTYYIASIGTNTITLSSNAGLSAPVTGLTTYTYNPYGASNTNYYMTVNALLLTSIANRGQSIVPWAVGGYKTFGAGSAATHTPNTGVIQINGTASPVVSHWGAAFVQDGGFDTDRSYIFNYSQPNVNISTKKTTAFAVRLAPSVSNALTGDLGGRELINRASFLLQTLESCAGNTSNANTAIVIEGILNPSNYPALSNIQWASLSSAVNPSGQPSFSQVAPGSSMVFTNSANNFTTITNVGGLGVGALSMTVVSTTGIKVGDDVFFPATTNACQGLTKVTAINSLTITFNFAIVTAVSASSIVQFSRGTYALPGETVFSYVNSPANKDALDLTPFKELTNTPIGGRGTYPNGCDVLFINAYITQGTPLNQNLVLRWGEAQA